MKFKKKTAPKQSIFQSIDVQSGLPGRMGVAFQNRESLLTQYTNFYGSDKSENPAIKTPFAWPPHNYTDLYELLFRGMRHSVETVVECGIGSNFDDVESNMGASGRPGASLRAWRDYFTQARVIGIDIDGRVLFSEDRIETFEVDQTSQESIQSWLSEAKIFEIDLFVDDGLHTATAAQTLFDACFGRLRPGTGLYIIEDVSLDMAEELVGQILLNDLVCGLWLFELDRKTSSNFDNRVIVVAR